MAYSKAKDASERFELFQLAVCPFGFDGTKVVAFPRSRIGPKFLSSMFNTVAGKKIAVLSFAFKEDTGDTSAMAFLVTRQTSASMILYPKGHGKNLTGTIQFICSQETPLPSSRLLPPTLPPSAALPSTGVQLCLHSFLPESVDCRHAKAKREPLSRASGRSPPLPPGLWSGAIVWVFCGRLVHRPPAGVR
ncbi:UDP-glucose 6-dehydrogenase 1 [Nymphaea thermarum]|nr:UDP-glucose 6-dehydrogenase 1 [Nymphaea thermarum]